PSAALLSRDLHSHGAGSRCHYYHPLTRFLVFVSERVRSSRAASLLAELISLSGEVDWRWCATRGSRRARWTATQQGGNIRDTTEVNTSAAETTRTDQQATQLRERALALESQAAHVPQPIGDRLRASAARLRDQAGKHDRTRITTAKDAD